MRFMNLALITVTLVMLLNLPLATLHAQDTFTPTFEESECPFELTEGYVQGEDITCGYVTVPANHANPGGATIQLAVAVIPATGDNPASDPLVLAQGGPGGSTLDLYGNLFFDTANGDFSYVLNDRDIVLIEQRGTLYSLPDLVCEEDFDLTVELLDEDLPIEDYNARSLEASLACRERLLGEGISLNDFDSVENAADVPMVIEALGYDAYNYYGVSYGTLLAQHLLRDHPEGLRSVILDAVVPTDQNFIPLVGVTAQRSIQLLFDTCAADDDCNSRYPNLEQTFYDMVDSLNANPVPVQVSDLLNNSGDYTVLVTGDYMVGFLFQNLYSTPLIPLLPSLITLASQGNYLWVEFIAPYFIFDRTPANGMYISVLCAEDADFTNSDIPIDGLSPQIVEAITPSSAFFPELCAGWGIEPLETYVDDPVVSEIPVLILNGEFDPITPPSNGEIVAASLPNSFNYTFPGHGHGAFILGSPCATEIALAFLNDPASQPDSSCIDDLSLSFQ